MSLILVGFVLRFLNNNNNNNNNSNNNNNINLIQILYFNLIILNYNFICKN